MFLQVIYIMKTDPTVTSEMLLILGNLSSSSDEAQEVRSRLSVTAHGDNLYSPFYW